MSSWDFGAGIVIDDMGITTTSTAAAASLTLNYTPTSSQSVLFAGFTQNNFGSGGISTPSGWTLVGSTSFASGARATYLFAKLSGSIAASSVTATTAGATGMAGGIIEVKGIAVPISLSSVLTNTGTTVIASAQGNIAGGGTGTNFVDTTPAPWYAISVCGASASLSAITHVLTVYTAGSNTGQAMNRIGGAATSTSAGIGACYATAPYNAVSGASQSYGAWINSAFTSRTQGIVSVMVTPNARTLTTMGAGG